MPPLVSELDAQLVLLAREAGVVLPEHLPRKRTRTVAELDAELTALTQNHPFSAAIPRSVPAIPQAIQRENPPELEPSTEPPPPLDSASESAARNPRPESLPSLPPQPEDYANLPPLFADAGLDDFFQNLKLDPGFVPDEVPARPAIPPQPREPEPSTTPPPGPAPSLGELELADAALGPGMREPTPTPDVHPEVTEEPDVSFTPIPAPPPPPRLGALVGLSGMLEPPPAATEDSTIMLDLESFERDRH